MGGKTSSKETDVHTGLDSRVYQPRDALDRCDGCATLTNGDGRGSVERGARAASRDENFAADTGWALSWSGQPRHRHRHFSANGQTRAGSVTTSGAGRGPRSTRPEVCGSANRLVGADKVGEIEEQKGLTSVPKACDRVVVCRAVHLSVQRVNCWIAFQKASQINPAVWRFGSSRSSVVGQTGALTNEPWSFWASPFSGVEHSALDVPPLPLPTSHV